MCIRDRNVRAETQLLGYAGDPLSTRLIRFEMGRENEVCLVEPDTDKWVKDTASEIGRLMRATENRAVAMAFEVKARGKESVLIDMTDVLMTDNNIFSLKDMKATLGLGGYQADRASIAGCSVFADNVVFRMIKCYGAGAAPQLSPFAREAKVEQNPTVWELSLIHIFSGGSENVRYYTSLGFSDENGNIRKENNKRYTGMAKINVNYKDFTMQFSLNGNLQKKNYTPCLLYTSRCV